MIRKIIEKAKEYTEVNFRRPNRVKLGRNLIYEYHEGNYYRSVLSPDYVHGMEVVPVDEDDIIEPYYEEE